MPEVVRIVKGDRLRPLTGTLRDSQGNAVDLTGCTLEFRMVDDEGTAKIVGSAATVTDYEGGTFSYSWGANDLDTAGVYRGTIIREETASGKVEHFPGDGDTIKIIIVEPI